MIKICFRNAILFATTSLSTLSATQYTMTELGTLSADSSSPDFIDENGDVMGHYVFQNKEYQFHWDQKTGLNNLDLPQDCIYKMTLPNKNGKVVGNVFKGNDYQGTFFWTKAQGLVVVNVGTSKTPTIAAINDQGYFVGHYVNNDGVTIPFYHDGSKIDLDLPSGDLGMPMRLQNIVGMTNEGHVVANCHYDIIHKGKIVKTITKAVFWYISKGWEPQELFEHDLTQIS